MSTLQYTARTVRDTAILTASYVPASALGYDDNNRIQELNQTVFFIDLTIGSLTSMEFKIEFSDNNVDWYQQSFIDISGGTASVSLGEYTFDSTGQYELATPFKAQYVRVSVKGTGTASGSSCKITGIIGMS